MLVIHVSIKNDNSLNEYSTTRPPLPIYLARLSDQWVVCTPLSYDVTNEMFLSVVRSQDGDLLSGITNQAHVHKDSHSVFGLA